MAEIPGRARLSTCQKRVPIRVSSYRRLNTATEFDVALAVPAVSMPKTQSHRMSLVANLTARGSDPLDFWLVGLIRFVSNRATL